MMGNNRVKNSEIVTFKGRLSISLDSKILFAIKQDKRDFNSLYQPGKY